MKEIPKSAWRFIPKPIFQGLALFLLLGCLGLTVETVWHRSWPFDTLVAALGEEQWWLASFLTFLVLFVGWVLINLPLRIFSQMPTYREELTAAGAKDFAALYQQQREKMFLDRENDDLTPEQQAIRSRGLALGGLLLGAITGTAAVVIFLVSDLIWLSGIVITLVGLLLGSWNGLKSWRLSK